MKRTLCENKATKIMTQQGTSKLWAAVKGALVSTAVLLAFLFISIFWPTDPPVQDGAMRGAISTFAFTPLFFIVVFVYFMLLSIKPKRTLRRAIVAQTIMLAPLAFFVFYIASKEAGIIIGAVNGLYTLIFPSIIFGLGAWAWSR